MGEFLCIVSIALIEAIEINIVFEASKALERIVKKVEELRK